MGLHACLHERPCSFIRLHGIALCLMDVLQAGEEAACPGSAPASHSAGCLEASTCNSSSTCSGDTSVFCVGLLAVVVTAYWYSDSIAVSSFRARATSPMPTAKSSMSLPITSARVNHAREVVSSCVMCALSYWRTPPRSSGGGGSPPTRALGGITAIMAEAPLVLAVIFAVSSGGVPVEILSASAFRISRAVGSRVHIRPTSTGRTVGVSAAIFSATSSATPTLFAESSHSTVRDSDERPAVAPRPII